MYEIQFRKHTLMDNGHPIHQNIQTLAEAKALRAMSGDLVIDSYTKKVVISDEWLFDWEKKNSKSCAFRAISMQLRVNLRDSTVPEHVRNSPGPSAEGRMCWVWSHYGFEDDAILVLVMAYEPGKEEPYRALFAGSYAHFMFAREQGYGHPSLAKKMDEVLWKSEYSQKMDEIVYHGRAGSMFDNTISIRRAA